MDRIHFSPVLVILAILMLVVLVMIGAQFLGALQTSPASQFALARHRWETNAISHYRMNASYYGNWSQCYYDVEVLQMRIVRIFTSDCLGNGDSKTLSVDGIFGAFEQYANQQVCGLNGCYCEGFFGVSATYDPTLGYPQSIMTVFRRTWLGDLLNSNVGFRHCLRADRLVGKFEHVTITILP
jgi:hypothetical protein